ncbi:hypothetical protein HDU86_007535 [Geranomyces michiganensis]|nr:hypothetical protein HDU86_007535 [Geranomyces michiganensis]
MAAIRYVPSFLYSQFFETPPVPTTDFTGQTIIVTGANQGLGFEAARHFARLGANLILACRNVSKAEAAKADIEKTTGSKTVQVWELDLSRYDSVKAFAKRVQGLERLDAIVENAGISTLKYSEAEGNESTITTNVVSTFLLALLVLPKLRESAKKFNIVPHLTIVSSEVHFFTSFPESQADDIFAELNDQKKARMWDRYNVSKAMEVLICRELTELMASPTSSRKPFVVLNFLNPGMCHSELAGEFGTPVKVLKYFLARTTEVGSRTLVHAVEIGKESHGRYLSNSKVTPVAAWVESDYGIKAQKKLWKQFAPMLERIQPGILANI